MENEMKDRNGTMSCKTQEEFENEMHKICARRDATLLAYKRAMDDLKVRITETGIGITEAKGRLEECKAAFQERCMQTAGMTKEEKRATLPERLERQKEILRARHEVLVRQAELRKLQVSRTRVDIARREAQIGYYDLQHALIVANPKPLEPCGEAQGTVAGDGELKF